MGSNLRILHVLGGLDIGGAETFVMNVYRNINRNIIQFDFVKHTSKAQFFDEEIEKLGGKIYSCPKFKGYNFFSYISWWWKFFKQHPEYKIIHGHVRSTAAIYLKIAKSFKRTTISHSHNTGNKGVFLAFIKNILQLPIRYIADYFFACSQDAGKWLFGKEVIKQNNFFVIPNAIDTNKFAYNPIIRQSIRKKLKIENNLILGNVGRFTIQKNQSFLLKIFSKVYEQSSNTRLLLVGYGELKEKLIQEAKDLNVYPYIIFSNGQIPSADYYQAMDVFVFPSLYEGLGIVLIEAQTSGLPCVISDNLPKEVDLECGLITRINLKQSINYWTEQILKQINKIRISQQQVVITKCYDISATTQWLENFYLKRL